MKKTIISLITAAALALPGSVLAVDVTGETQSDQMSGQQSYSESELKEMKVVSRDNEHLGTIKDVSLDEQNDQINFVTIERSDVVSAQPRVSIPIEALNIDTEQQQATLTVDKAKLENAPRQANLDDETFERELESHYGIAPVWDQQQQQPLKEEQDIGEPEE